MWWLGASLLATAACASTTTTSAVAPTASSAPVSTASPAVSGGAPTTVDATPLSTTSTSLGTPSPTKTLPPTLDSEVLADISMTSVPADVIVPTNDQSLDPITNPINGRRGGGRTQVPEDLDCATEATGNCLIGTLDMLGFDVTSGSLDERERRLQRATAVVQLDAGLPKTGLPDDDLFQYLGIGTDASSDGRVTEERQIGRSAEGRPIVAIRSGDGPRTVLVVGQTHGDEEGGLRVLLRARSLALPEAITLWVIPTMNPDGLVLDTRFLSNGIDPNRAAPSQPEQQAVYDFALDVRPSLTVWYHQNYGWVGGSGASATPAMQYQTRTGLGTLKRSGDCAKGFMWCPIDDALGSSSILVELPDVLTPAEVQIHALALLAVASGDA